MGVHGDQGVVKGVVGIRAGEVKGVVESRGGGGQGGRMVGVKG